VTCPRIPLQLGVEDLGFLTRPRFLYHFKVDDRSLFDFLAMGFESGLRYHAVKRTDCHP